MARYDQCDGTCTTDCGHCKGAMGSYVGREGYKRAGLVIGTAGERDAFLSGWLSAGEFVAAQDAPDREAIAAELELDAARLDMLARAVTSDEAAAALTNTACGVRYAAFVVRRSAPKDR